MSTTVSQRIPSRAWPLGRGETTTVVLTAVATIAILFSIAASQILLGAALLLLLLSRRAIRFPTRFGVALLAFLGWTLLSLAFSSTPWTGLSQIRKLFLFASFLLAYNAYYEPRQVWRTVQAVVLGGAIAALYGLAQFAQDYWNLARQGLPFYENYVVHQITGFMGHWMTFSGQLMMVLLLAASILLFGGLAGKLRAGGWLSVGLIGVALLATFTRGVWLGTFAGLAYLLARSQRRLLWLLPVGLLLLYLASPVWLQRRGESIFDVQTDTSNQARLVMLSTGLKMIAAHPWFGIGPERVGPEFQQYKPAAVPFPPGWYGHLHNDYLQLAAERGIPCLLFWLWMLIEVFRANLSLARGPAHEARALGHAAVAITLGMMVSGLFEFNFGDSEVLMLYLYLISAPYAWARLEEQALREPLHPDALSASLPRPKPAPEVS
ncbi:MAG: hypothetical protein A3J28_15365 [Acidobacteria bacterium RIFCSPLOWO2_12_FULL_60_22]|nr:MAG: hypothetical protein A3J28_15365 [Acidobacteria bacterium RIFCSPLOWO2_12_FULL_60_22]